MYLEIAVLTIPICPIGHLETENATGDGETKGPNHLSFLGLHRTVILRVTEVHCQQRLQCHPDQTTQTGQGIPDEVDNIKKKCT